MMTIAKKEKRPERWVPKTSEACHKMAKMEINSVTPPLHSRLERRRKNLSGSTKYARIRTVIEP